MKLICAIVLLGILGVRQEQSLIDKQWVMVGYDKPGHGFNGIPPSDYKESCKFKWTIRPEPKGRFVTTVNDKFTFNGTYKLKGGDRIEIRSKIIEKVVDIEQRCHVDTESRILLKELFDTVTRYSLRNDTLVFSYESSSASGAMKFVPQ